MKQISYISRLSIVVLVAELVYINFFVIFRYSALKSTQQDLSVYDKPIIPFFFSFLASSAGQYEGNPIIPAIYANSKNKEDVSKGLTLAVLVLATYVIISSPISVLAFGEKI